MTKKCYQCKKNKSVDLFNKNKRRSDGLQNLCRDCQKAYKDNHYSLHRRTYICKARVRSLEVQAAYLEWKKQFACELCGENHPACLDFHHVNRKKKSFGISQGIRRFSLEAVKREALKCKVLCSNCHRKIHYKE